MTKANYEIAKKNYYKLNYINIKTKNIKIKANSK